MIRKQHQLAKLNRSSTAHGGLDRPALDLLGRIDPSMLRLLPDFGNWELLMGVFIIPLAVQWWSVWYPGAEPGGGSYIAQRILAAKDEKHAMGATLWFNVAVGLRVADRVLHVQISTYQQLAYSVALTTAVWVVVTFLTRPAERQTLIRFYELVRPFGPGWKSSREQAAPGRSPDRFTHCLLGWFLGCVLVYTGLFGTGFFLYRQVVPGVLCAIPFVAGAAGLSILVPRMFSKAA